VERVVLESYHLFQITHHLSIKARHGTEIGIDRGVVGVEWVRGGVGVSVSVRETEKWNESHSLGLIFCCLFVYLFFFVTLGSFIYQNTGTTNDCISNHTIPKMKKEREREKESIVSCVLASSTGVVEGDSSKSTTTTGSKCLLLLLLFLTTSLLMM